MLLFDSNNFNADQFFCSVLKYETITIIYPHFNRSAER